jgi:hypothetical protein
MNYWLKSIGSAEETLEKNWLDSRYDLLDEVRFAVNKRPTGIARDDRLVFYAAGWGCFYGVAIVTSVEPRKDLRKRRWPWVLDVTVPLVVPRLDLAPRLHEMGVASTSVRQQSHIALTREKFERALTALTRLID